jgi:hypothetical protein
MSNRFRSTLADLGAFLAGRESPAAPPRPGTDPTSRRHFLALVIGTLAIGVIGILVAVFYDGGSSDGAATPTPVVSPATDSGRLVDARVRLG